MLRLTLVPLLLMANLLLAAPKPHSVILGKPITVKWLVGPEERLPIAATPRARPVENFELNRFARAPLCLAVLSTPKLGTKPIWEQELSAGAVCMNLTIAATAMGFATAWLTEWYGYDRGVLTDLGLGENEKIAGFIHIGRAPGPRDRRISAPPG